MCCLVCRASSPGETLRTRSAVTLTPGRARSPGKRYAQTIRLVVLHLDVTPRRNVQAIRLVDKLKTLRLGLRRLRRLGGNGLRR